MRTVFSVISGALMLLAGALLLYAVTQVIEGFRLPEVTVGPALLEAVGYTIISLAVFEVAKYLPEEEVLHPSEMRDVGEARRGMTKFLSTISIAVFLEALVMVFEAGQQEVQMMLYPTLLLLAGVALVVGLGAYQRLSASAERAQSAVQDADSEETRGPNRRNTSSESKQDSRFG